MSTIAIGAHESYNPDMGRRIAYGLFGAALGVAILEPLVFAFKHRFANGMGAGLIALNFFNLAVWIAQRTGRLPSAPEPPITLFPHGIPGPKGS
jgi:hypothetical protein